MPANPKPQKAPDGRSEKRPGLEEQRRAILDASVELFRQQGSKAVSISQICQQAGISRPTFYRCFADKDALVMALYDTSVTQPVEAIMLRGLSGAGGDAGKVKAALDELFDTIFDNARFAELVFMESSDPSSPAYTIVDQAFSGLATGMAKGIQRRGGKQPSLVLLKALMAANQWIVHDAIRKGLDSATREEAKAAAWELTQRMLYSDSPGTQQAGR